MPSLRLLLFALLLAACGGEVGPTGQPTLDPSAFPPLPPLVSGIPGPGIPTAMIEPVSPHGELAPGTAAEIVLGHCGLASPLDLDGSLWDPIGGHDGRGGPLTEAQVGELINATGVVVLLVNPNTAVLTTPRGAAILLRRHAGARAYGLCD
jgi:hypothetical protein